MSVAVGVTAVGDPSALWERFADIERWPEWNPACLEASMLGPLTTGTQMRLNLLHPRGRAFWTTPRLTTVIAGETLAWETRGFGFRSPTIVTFTPDADGTRIRLESTTTGPLGFTYRLTFPDTVQGQVWSGTLTALAQAARNTPDAGGSR